MNRKNLSRKPRKGLVDRQRSRLRTLALRGGAWAMFVLIPVAIVLTLKVSLHRIFFAANTHFLLRDIRIDIVKGSFSRDHVQKRLSLSPGSANLFDVDPRQLRARLLADPIVQEAEIRRIWPGALEVTVFGRTPVAQLINRGGRLIDAAGIILGHPGKNEGRKWPIVTGIPNESSYKTGDPLSVPLLPTALEFLKIRELLAATTWLDVNIIQLDENYGELRVFLNGKPEFLIADDAVLILPAQKLRSGVKRALSILEHRIQARQPTSFIDATYEKRIPVRP